MFTVFKLNKSKSQKHQQQDYQQISQEVNSNDKIISFKRAYKKRNHYVPPLEEIKSLFSMSLHNASKKLNISVSKLKKICRSYGIHNWPFKNKDRNTKMPTNEEFNATQTNVSSSSAGGALENPASSMSSFTASSSSSNAQFDASPGTNPKKRKRKKLQVEDDEATFSDFSSHSEDEEEDDEHAEDDAAFQPPSHLQAGQENALVSAGGRARREDLGQVVDNATAHSTPQFNNYRSEAEHHKQLQQVKSNVGGQMPSTSIGRPPAKKIRLESKNNTRVSPQAAEGTQHKTPETNESSSFRVAELASQKEEEDFAKRAVEAGASSFTRFTPTHASKETQKNLHVQQQMPTTSLAMFGRHNRTSGEVVEVLDDDEEATPDSSAPRQIEQQPAPIPNQQIGITSYNIIRPVGRAVGISMLNTISPPAFSQQNVAPTVEKVIPSHHQFRNPAFPAHPPQPPKTPPITPSSAASPNNYSPRNDLRFQQHKFPPPKTVLSDPHLQQHVQQPTARRIHAEEPPPSAFRPVSSAAAHYPNTSSFLQPAPPAPAPAPAPPVEQPPLIFFRRRPTPTAMLHFSLPTKYPERFLPIYSHQQLPPTDAPPQYQQPQPSPQPVQHPMEAPPPRAYYHSHHSDYATPTYVEGQTPQYERTPQEPQTYYLNNQTPQGYRESETHAENGPSASTPGYNYSPVSSNFYHQVPNSFESSPGFVQANNSGAFEESSHPGRRVVSENASYATGSGEQRMGEGWGR